MGILLITAFVFSSPGWEYRTALMGAEVHIQIPEISSVEQVKAYKTILPVIESLEALEQEISPWVSDSTLSHWNNVKAGEWIEFSRTAFAIVENSVKWAELSGGAFDPTFLSVGQLWKFSKESFVLPSRRQIESRLALVDYRGIELHSRLRRVLKKRDGIRLGLGGLAKGTAVDLLVSALRKSEFRDFSIQFGGELYIAGTKAGRLHRVGIQHPRKPNDIVGYIHVQDSAFASSGDYERFFVHNGIRYHHILDPKTGFPARLCQGVHILAGSSEAADALATAVFVLGSEKGLTLIESIPDVEGLIIASSGQWILSSGMADKFTPTTPKRPPEKLRPSD